MPVAMSVVWEVAKKPEKSKKIAKLLRKFDRVLGIKIDKSKTDEIPEEIKELLELRKKAREDKNWELSDQLRDELREKGYIVKDTKEGMTLEKV